MKYSVLLVDDEEPALLGLEEGIRWEELNVDRLYKTHSKDTAIRMLNTYSIDIVITDIEMPNGTGVDLIRWLREKKSDVKAIFYTGHAEFSYAQQALRLGVEDYLLKPVPYEQLEEIIRNVENKIQIEKKTVDFAELAEDCNDTGSGEIVEKVKKIIAENISESTLQRDEIAAMVHVSPGYLGRIFKKEMSLSLSDYIMKKRISVAKQLLLKTGLSITEVSSRVGFSYSSYFTKLFKEQVGMTPQEYRQQNK